MINGLVALHNIKRNQRFVCQVEDQIIVKGSCINLKPEIKLNFKIVEGANVHKIVKQFELHADDPVPFEMDIYNKENAV